GLSARRNKNLMQGRILYCVMGRMTADHSMRQEVVMIQNGGVWDPNTGQGRPMKRVIPPTMEFYWTWSELKEPAFLRKGFLCNMPPILSIRFGGMDIIWAIVIFSKTGSPMQSPMTTFR